MNHRLVPRPEAAVRRLGTGRRGRPTVPRLRRYLPQPVRVGLVVLLGAAAVTVVLAADGDAAYAAEPASVVLAVESIQQVANNIRAWLVGILVAVATLFLTVGGLRYLAANGDPGEVEKAKLALRSAALGYALALLAPLFVTIVGGWVA
ncbi:pilin [Micromonospora sp. WMMD1082]|uniref:pilin n=1 Tax=Micromonospora sp. WMMD1082 TaxID=3016104 RepID=UPI002415C52B|nr:pilin [Micromonospora sp. WMMD1082]MDG4793529.1 pilin [Micromonospora sp. WMMD1082]